MIIFILLKIISISLFLGGWTDHNRPDPRHIIITLTQTQRLLTSITALCLRLKHNNDPEKAGKIIKIKIVVQFTADEEKAKV